MHAQGLYQDKPRLPFIPGSEVSGIVTEVGQKVKALKLGDHVRSCSSGLCPDVWSQICRNHQARKPIDLQRSDIVSAAF